MKYLHVLALSALLSTTILIHAISWDHDLVQVKNSPEFQNLAESKIIDDDEIIIQRR